MNNRWLFGTIAIIILVLSVAYFVKGASPSLQKKAHSHEHNHKHDHQGHGSHDHKSKAGSHDHQHDASEESDDDDDDEFISMSESQIESNGIQIKKAQKGDISHQIRVTGKIQLKPDQTAHIVPHVDAIVVSAYKKIGDKVEKNDVLAVLESREVAEAKAGYLAAIKREKLKQTVFSREKELLNKQASSQQEFLEAQHNAEEAQIDAELALQKLYALGVNTAQIDQLLHVNNSQLRQLELRAPLAGTVIHRNLIQGEHIAANHLAFTVANLDELQAEIDLPSNAIGCVKEGMTLELIGENNQKAHFHINSVNGIIQNHNRKGQALADIDNTSRLWIPGAFISGTITCRKEELSIVVPKTALQHLDGLPTVFIGKKDGFQIRPVVVGREDNQSYSITDGLSEGELIAATNTYLLKAEHEKESVHHEH